ncbi:MAG: hypothetical protein HND47_18440 [Chloroflexi bacterium]|nr:hypothetical protein [Chloroflexota bacterium]
MTGKISRTKKQTRGAEEVSSRRQRAAQILFAVFAVILILSMVLSAVTNF